MPRRAVSPVIAIVLLLMMTVAAAGAAYFWLTQMQSSVQEQSTKSIENIMEASGRRVTAQATLCKPTYPYKGLKGYWMMDEGSGSYANDSSGNENDGTIYGATWTDGKVRQALGFDGTDDYVWTGTNEMINNKDKTFLFWIKTNDLDAGCPIGNAHLGAPGNQLGISFRVYNDGDLLFRVANESSYFVVYGTGNVIERDKWYFITGIHDYSSGEMSLWVNGEKIGTNSVIGYSKGRNFHIGATGNTQHFFNGTTDEVRLYDRALSENEIKELYEAENHSARRRIDITVRNIGSEEIPKATWVANLKHDGTTVETDAHNASSIDTGELSTLKFYFKDFKPNTKYTIELQGTGTSTTVSC